MKKIIYLITLLFLQSCSDNEKTLSLNTNRKKIKATSYHTFNDGNARDNNTFPPFWSGELANVNEDYHSSHNPLIVRNQLIIVNAYWSDGIDIYVTEPITFEVYASLATSNNITPPDSSFTFVASKNSLDGDGIEIELDSNNVGNNIHKIGQYLHFKYLWRDSLNNISTPVYESKKIELISSAKQSTGGIITSWLSNTSQGSYIADSVIEYHIDSTYSTLGTNYITQDTVFNNLFYLGATSVIVSKNNNPNIVTVSYKTNLGYVITSGDWNGLCCNQVGVGPQLFSVIRSKSQKGTSTHFKFDGVKVFVHQ